MTPMAAMMRPGTMKERPQLEETQYPAIREPRMFPTEVWEFQSPMMSPRLPTPQDFITKPIRSQPT